MGFHVTWVAVQATARDDTLRELGLQATPEREEFPESELTGIALDTGWYVVFDNSMEHPLNDDLLAGLSRSGDVLQVMVEETTMSFVTACFRRGALAWRVTHLGGDDVMHLDVGGTPPAPFEELRRFHEEEARANADDCVDYMCEVPVELAKVICGFRHDQGPPAEGDEPFEVLARRAAPKRTKPRSRLAVEDESYTASWLSGGLAGVVLNWFSRRDRAVGRERSRERSRKRRDRRDI